MDTVLIYGSLVYLFIMFLIAQIFQNRSLANFSWGGGVCLLTLYSFFAAGNYVPRAFIASVLTGIWGLRLTGFLVWRQLKMEDKRYKDWATAWSLKEVGKTFAWVFLGQGLGLLVMALPNLLINYYSGPGLHILDIVAVAVWFFGFYYETVADYQLYVFRDIPSDQERLLQEGLWSKSRHPNYFGEFVLWCGMTLLAFSVSYGWCALVTPLFAYSVLRHFSTPMVERVLKRIEGFGDYAKKVPIFFPKW